MTEENNNNDQNSTDEWEKAMQEQQDQSNGSSEPEQDSKLDVDSDEQDDWAAAMAEQQAAEQDDDTPQSAEDDWAAAMAEQQSGAEEDASESGADDWAAAMAEQESSEQETQTSESQGLFKPLDQGVDHKAARDLDMIMEIPVTLSVELGQTRLTIQELLDLAKGSVVELDGLAGEPMDILINGYLIAQGEVVVVDDKYGIRITDIMTPTDRIHKINRQ